LEKIIQQQENPQQLEALLANVMTIILKEKHKEETTDNQQQWRAANFTRII
jgi:hypothetical protein